MLKIIVPLAGSSELYKNAGYVYPKPLIEVNGVLMIELIIEKTINIKVPYQFIFIIKEEDSKKFHLDSTLKLLSPGSEVILLKKDTKGGLCSVLMAIDKIDANDSLLIMNGDQIIDVDINTILNFWEINNADAAVVTFKSVHPRWSYARIEEGQVLQTAEKNPISSHAIAGIYYYHKADEFFDGAFQTIKNNVHLDGNFYISPVMNEYVLKNKIVLNYKIENEQYHSFYSPQMLMDFEKR